MTRLQVKANPVLRGLTGSPDVTPGPEMVIPSNIDLGNRLQVALSQESAVRFELHEPQDATDLDLDFQVRRPLTASKLLDPHGLQCSLRRKPTLIGVDYLEHEIDPGGCVERQRSRIDLLSKQSHDRSMPNG